jgi:hypothetical protein
MDESVILNDLPPRSLHILCSTVFVFVPFLRERDFLDPRGFSSAFPSSSSLLFSHPDLLLHLMSTRFLLRRSRWGSEIVLRVVFDIWPCSSISHLLFCSSPPLLVSRLLLLAVCRALALLLPLSQRLFFVSHSLLLSSFPI